MESSGQQINVVPIVHTQVLSDLDHEYVSGDATKTSAIVHVKNFIKGTLCFTLVSTGTPTDIAIDLEVSADGSQWYKKADTYWADLIFDDTVCSSAIDRAYTFDIDDSYRWLRFTVTATGVGAASTTSFTLSNTIVMLKSR